MGWSCVPLPLLGGVAFSLSIVGGAAFTSTLFDGAALGGVAIPSFFVMVLLPPRVWRCLLSPHSGCHPSSLVGGAAFPSLLLAWCCFPPHP